MSREAYFAPSRSPRVLCYNIFNMYDLEKRLSALKQEFQEAYARLDVDTKLGKREELEAAAADPDLWRDVDHARSVTRELATLEAETDPWTLLDTQISDLGELLSIADPELTPEISRELEAMENGLGKLKKSLRFQGPYDSYPAIIRITSGAGGTEAMDWASMLERMYLRFLEQNGYEFTELERTPGEEAGIKTAVYEVNGPHAFGTLRSENGVHRLVRLSPFNANNLRQTSFALVEILPVIKADTEIEIDEKDLRIDVYHSGGHGGQSVNTTNSAVRITHLPTHTVVAIQNERSQLQNKTKAMEVLRGKLAQMQLEQHAATIGELRAGESASWGQQIRNYVLQPYKLVKDTRTGYEEAAPDAVLDGKLSGFIDSFLESGL